MDALLRWIDGLPLMPLAVIAVVMLLAPFTPEPHLVEKWRMLRAGELHRPIDIFDVAWHLAPTLLLLVHLVRRN